MPTELHITPTPPMPTTLVIIITALLCAAAGIAIGYLMAAQRSHTIDTERQLAVSRLEDARTTHAQQLAEVKAAADRQLAEAKESAAQQLNEARAAADRQLSEAKESAAQQLAEVRAAHDRQLAEAKSAADKLLADTKAAHSAQMAQQVALLQQQIKTATEQLRTTSEEVLRSRSEELQHANAEQLGHIIEPLKTSLKTMQDQVIRTDKEQNEKMARLDETIKATLSQTALVSESADRLATALTSENKRQGNFGELQLKTLLDNMGFEEGLQYETQVTLRDDTGTVIHDPDNGQRLQPDVVVHFPEGRDLIIDSKMSLKAFAEYFDAADDETRAAAIQRHVLSVRNHVDELAAKKYNQYITGQRQTVDFVVMYLYSDSALQLAMSADPRLWEDAAQKGVLITGSHNLYMMLRIVAMAWERMRQSENQQRIIEQANLIVSRVQTFYARLLDVEAQFHKAQTAFDALKTTTADRGQSIITPARTLIRLGAKEDKAKTKKALPHLDDEDSTDAPALEAAPAAAE